MPDSNKYRFDEEYPERRELTRAQKNKRKQEEMMRRRQTKKRQAIVIAVVSVLIIAALGSFVAFSRTGLVSAEEENTVITAEMLPEKSGFTSISLMAAGDNLLHTKLYTQAQARANGSGYDFAYLYGDIAGLVKDTDICFINQETPLATAIKEVSSYPLFNTPSECITELHRIGFNVFNIVSNHTLDQGADGLKATIDFMETVPDSLYVGAYYNQEEMDKLHYLEIKGLKVAFLGFTEMTNGLTLSADSGLAFIYTSDETTMERLISEANRDADIVIVSVHWGEENVTSASEAQRLLAQKFADWGADLVIGHHPHVLEEIESVTSADGRTVPVVYSLGNLTSTMNLQSNHVGGFFKCNLVYDNATGELNIADEEFVPTINHFTGDKQNIHVVPYSDYNSSLEAENGFGITREYVDELLRSTVGSGLVKDLN